MSQDSMLFYVMQWTHNNVMEPLLDFFRNIRPSDSPIINLISLGLFVIGAFIFLLRRPKVATKPKDIVHGSAAWASEKEISKMGLLDRSGPILGLDAKDRFLTYKNKGHIAVIAPTRSGKGRGIVIPTLLSYPHSVIVIDIKGENYAKTSGYRSEISDCYRFAPTKQDSNAFNPLDFISRGDEMIGEAQALASSLMMQNDNVSENPHWHDTAWALLTTLILYVLENHPRKSLYGMNEVINDPNRNIREVLGQMLDGPNLQAIRIGARNMLNKSDDELSSVVSTASRHLALYLDPIIAANTDRSDFTIDQFVLGDKPTSLYMVVPSQDLERLAPLFRSIMMVIIKRLTKDISNRRPLLIVFDEFSAFGRIDFFETALSYVAGYDIKAMLIAQSINQIKKTYGPNTSILDQCECKVFLAPNDMLTANEISRLLGQQTIKDDRASYSSKNLSWSESYFGRPLMMPEEIMAMKNLDELILIKGQKPIKAKNFEYYDDSLFHLRSSMPEPRKVDLKKQVDSSPSLEKEPQDKVYSM